MGSTWGLKSTIVGTVYADFVTRSPYKSHHVATHGRNGAGKLAEGCPCCSAVRAQAPRRDNLVKQDPRFPVPRVHFPRQQIYLFYWTHVGIAGVSGGTPCEQPTEPQTHCAPSVDVGLKNDAGRLNTIGTAIGPLIFAAGRTYWGRLAHTSYYYCVALYPCHCDGGRPSANPFTLLPAPQLQPDPVHILCSAFDLIRTLLLLAQETKTAPAGHDDICE